MYLKCMFGFRPTADGSQTYTAPQFSGFVQICLEKFLSVAVPPAPCKSGSQITSIYLCHSITSTSWKASKLQKNEIFIISLPLKMCCCWSTQVYTVQPFGFHEGLYVPQIASQEKSSADNGQAKLSPPFHLRSSGQYVKCTATATHITSELSWVLARGLLHVLLPSRTARKTEEGAICWNCQTCWNNAALNIFASLFGSWTPRALEIEDWELESWFDSNSVMNTDWKSEKPFLMEMQS